MAFFGYSDSVSFANPRTVYSFRPVSRAIARKLVRFPSRCWRSANRIERLLFTVFIPSFVQHIVIRVKYSIPYFLIVSLVLQFIVSYGILSLTKQREG